MKRLRVSKKSDITKGLNQLTTKQKARIIAHKIHGQFPATPSGQLMFSIVEQALVDVAIDPDSKTNAIRRDEFVRTRDSAISFLRGEMLQAEIAGVEPAWVKKIIERVGLL